MPDPAGIAAVLWDMDGTLVDSEKVWDVSLADLAAHLGGELSAATREGLVGAWLGRAVTSIRRDVGLDPDDETAVADDSRWLLDRTMALFAEGLPTALVTSTYREVTEIALDTIGREWFDVVVCGDEVSATKPDPAPYRRAAELLGVDAARCVAVEDSATGTTAAVASGATVLVVPSAPPSGGVPSVPAGERRVLRESLEGLTVDELGGLLSGAAA